MKIVKQPFFTSFLFGLMSTFALYLSAAASDAATASSASCRNLFSSETVILTRERLEAMAKEVVVLKQDLTHFDKLSGVQQLSLLRDLIELYSVVEMNGPEYKKLVFSETRSVFDRGSRITYYTYFPWALEVSDGLHFPKDLLISVASQLKLSEISKSDLSEWYFSVITQLGQIYNNSESFKYGPISKVLDSIFVNYIHFDFKEVELRIRAREYESPGERGRLSKIGGKAMWSHSNEMSGWLTSAGDIVAILQNFGFKNNGRFVDIGSATGKVGFIVGTLFPQAKYTGYEIVEERVEYSIQKATELGFKAEHVQFIQRDLSDSQAIAPADLYYFYDPVNEPTFNLVIDKIIRANPDTKNVRIYIREGSKSSFRYASANRNLVLVEQITHGVAETINVYQISQN